MANTLAGPWTLAENQALQMWLPYTRPGGMNVGGPQTWPQIASNMNMYAPDPPRRIYTDKSASHQWHDLMRPNFYREGGGPGWANAPHGFPTSNLQPPREFVPQGSMVQLELFVLPKDCILGHKILLEIGEGSFIIGFESRGYFILQVVKGMLVRR